MRDVPGGTQMTHRERLLTETFVSLADTLVGDFDMVEFLSLLSGRCVDLLGAEEAGLMLTDADGHMRPAASSSHRMKTLELLEIQYDEGPCPDAFRTGVAVSCADLGEAQERWPTTSWSPRHSPMSPRSASFTTGRRRRPRS